MADIERALAAQVGWNWVDDHLVYACEMLSRLRAGGIAALEPYPTSILMDDQETCFGEGQGVWAAFRSPELPPPLPPTIAPPVIAAVTPTTPVFVPPRGSSRRDIQRARTAANAAAFNARQRSEQMAVQMVRAAAEAARVANAAAAAARSQAMQPRWIPEASGRITVTNRRIHLTNQYRSSPIPLTALEHIELTQPDRLRIRFTEAATSHYLELATPWAAPAFLVASQARFPHHPQLISGSWLPHGFEDRCHIAGKACPRVR
ncbi:hypothetical protein ACFU44_33005 [Nocardia rhizosphaerihabitans]|uniref:hypothetical protein n=1 Tax=Nocardia rhizosphaerihabitans TaxID=1691570 RepID=UPI00366D3035